MSEEIENFEDEKSEATGQELIDILNTKIKHLEDRNEELKEQLRKRYSIFYPINPRRLLGDYPELKKAREFQDIGPYHLLFVWYFACDASPFARIIDDKERVKKAIVEAYKNLEVEEQEKYISGSFPEKIKLAISKMKTFRIGPRVIAMKMMEKILHNWQNIVDIDASDNSNFMGKDGIDWTKKKAFVETGANISKNIGSLIAQVEGSYAVSEKKNEEDTADLDYLIDNYHNSQ